MLLPKQSLPVARGVMSSVIGKFKKVSPQQIGFNPFPGQIFGKGPRPDPFEPDLNIGIGDFQDDPFVLSTEPCGPCRITRSRLNCKSEKFCFWEIEWRQPLMQCLTPNPPKDLGIDTRFLESTCFENTCGQFDRQCNPFTF